jgi:hypothetical protein
VEKDQWTEEEMKRLLQIRPWFTERNLSNCISNVEMKVKLIYE